ncbi:MAG: MFS transporter [Candidatus Tectimicrobiota bacterium]
MPMPPSDRLDDQTPYRPPWLRLLPFLLYTPALTYRQWHVLGLVAVASLFDRYDLALFSLALKQIQLSLDIAEGDLGALGAVVRLGALPAVLLMLAADRLGRRALLLGTMLGYTLLTGATAFVPDAETFVLVQLGARIFITAELLLATVVITEEFGPLVRGWGIGAVNALAAGGYALSWLLFAFVDLLPFGWRALYLVGLLPLGLITLLRRSMPETVHFAQRQAHAPAFSLRTLWLPLLALLRAYPGRLWAMSGVAFCMGFAESPALFFDPKYLQEAHELRPWQIAVLGACGGGVAVLGYTWAGWLGDQFGRKRATLFFLSTPPLCIIAFYHAPTSLLLPLWIAMVFTLLGANVSLATYGAELFPTSYRATATGIRAMLSTLGGVAGLALEGVVYDLVGSHWSAISLLALVLWLAPCVVALAFPETRGRSLEEIAPER